MCGRYRLSKTERYLLEKFGVQLGEDFTWNPRYNIAPSQQVPVIRQDKSEPKRTLAPMRWGLIPSWAKDESVGYKMINARAESIVGRPAFRQSFERRRCLIPTDGFYEWKKSGAGKTSVKQPFLIGMKDDDVFALAGIWDRWRSPQGVVIESCSILTTAANALVCGVHDRMPAIVAPEQYDLWLDPGFSNVENLTAMVKPYDAAQMRMIPVSSRVNSPDNDDELCAVEVQDSAAVPVEDQAKGAEDRHRRNGKNEDAATQLPLLDLGS